MMAAERNQGGPVFSNSVKLGKKQNKTKQNKEASPSIFLSLSQLLCKRRRPIFSGRGSRCDPSSWTAQNSFDSSSEAPSIKAH